MTPSFLRRLSLLAAACASLGAGSALRGSPVEIVQAVDLSEFIKANNDLHFSAAPTVRIADGDDVTITFNFNSQLSLANTGATAGSFSTGWPWLESWGDEGKFTISKVSISLLAPIVTGEAETTLWKAEESDGKVHLGPLGYFNLGAYSTVSFSGITATFHVEGVPGGTNSYQPWIHGYFDGLEASLTGGKRSEQRRSEYRVYTDEPDLTAGDYEGPTSAPSSGRYFSVPDNAPTVVLLLLGAVILRVFGVRPAGRDRTA